MLIGRFTAVPTEPAHRRQAPPVSPPAAAPLGRPPPPVYAAGSLVALFRNSRFRADRGPRRYLRRSPPRHRHQAGLDAGEPHPRAREGAVAVYHRGRDPGAPRGAKDRAPRCRREGHAQDARWEVSLLALDGPPYHGQLKRRTPAPHSSNPPSRGRCRDAPGARSPRCLSGGGEVPAGARPTTPSRLPRSARLAAPLRSPLKGKRPVPNRGPQHLALAR